MPNTPFDLTSLPAEGYARQWQLVGPAGKKASKTTPRILPFSSSTLWRMVKSGDFPAPVKLSERVTAWRVEDVRAWMEKQNQRRTA